jgi:transcriptional regulator with XRE-family HTH domain
MLTPLQSKMARTALGWNIRRLAEQANIAPNTVSNFETGKGRTNRANIAAIKRAFEGAGIIFLNGDGVRVRKPE